MMRPLALLLGLATLTPAAAAYAAPPPQSVTRRGSWAVVLVSTSSADEARRALAQVSGGVAQWVKPAEGYPKVVASATMPGLEPGAHLVVLGYCEKETDAAVAHGYARLAAPAAYFSPVDARIDAACPLLPGGERSKLGVPTERLATAQVPGEGDLRLEVLTGKERSQAECTVRDLAVQLRRGAELLDEYVWQAECSGACTQEEKESGALLRKSIEEAIERGESSESELEYNFTQCFALAPYLSSNLSGFGRPLFVIGLRQVGPHTDAYADYQAVGLGCRGTLAVSEVFKREGLLRSSWPDPFTEKEARPQDPKERWRSLQWYCALGNSNPLSDKRDVRLEAKWDEEGCRVSLLGEEAP